MTTAGRVSRPIDDPLGIIGTTIGDKYEIERFVAEGGFSLLYKAQHKGWVEPVAVKFLKVLKGAGSRDREMLRRSFVQEGQLLRSLSSRTASILQAHDLGDYVTSAGEWYPYLILEWLEGAPLDLVLQSERVQGAPPWSIEEIVRLLEPAAKALEVVHRKGVAHRDIKPGNIFVMGNPHSEDAFVKVLDFGIAKVISDMAELSAAHAQTGTGTSSFTPWYGAPEQFSKRYGATGPWTDVFALALVIVEMLTQRAPLDGEDIPALAHESTHAERRPTPRTRGVLVSDAVEAVFLKAFAVRTTERYETMGKFWGALCEAIGQKSPTTDPVPPTLDLATPASPSSLQVAAMGRALTPRASSVGVDKPTLTAMDDLDPPSPGERGALRTGAVLELSERELAADNWAEGEGARRAPGGGGGASSERAGESLPSGGKVTGTMALSRPPPAGGSGVRSALLVGLSMALFGAAVWGLVARLSSRAVPETMALSASTAAAALAPPIASSAPVAEPPPVVSVSIRVEPPGAQLFIDGELSPSNPYRGTFSRDGKIHRLRAVASGYSDKEQDVVFSESTVLTVTLEHQGAGVPVPRGAMPVPPSKGNSKGSPASKDGRAPRPIDPSNPYGAP